MTGRAKLSPWDALHLSLEVPGTPGTLSASKTFFVGYALGQKFHGCALPAGTATTKAVLESHSNVDDYTTFAFNGLPGADPERPGNWCWTTRTNPPQHVKAEPDIQILECP